MAKQKKSRGRDLKHTETQAAIQVSRYRREKGATHGREQLGAVSAIKPRLRRRKATEKRSLNMTKDDIINSGLPLVSHTKRGIVKMMSQSAQPMSADVEKAREKRADALRRLRAAGDVFPRNM